MLGTSALAGSSAQPPLPRNPMSIAGDNMERPLVLIVDDDEEIRFALEELLQSVGIDACCFGSTQELLHAALPDRPGCLILDVRMPGASGLDLQQHLAANGNTRPIIFLTGHGDIAMTVQAMKAGAADFLTKPVRDQTLLDAVTRGDREGHFAEDLGPAHQATCRPLRQTDAARTRSPARSGEGPSQQADRLRSRHQRGHRQAAPRQRDEEDAGDLGRSAHPHLGAAACGGAGGKITLDQRMVTVWPAMGQMKETAIRPGKRRAIRCPKRL